MRAVVSQAALMAKAAEGQVGEPGVFEIADPFLGSSSSALQRFEVGDVRIGLVGDEDLEAVPVDVGEGELGAGVGFLASGDGPSPVGPAGQIDHVGDLGDVGAFAFVVAIGGDGRLPPAGDNGQAGRADWFGQVVTDAEAHVCSTARVDEAVGERGGVGPSDDLDHCGIHRQLRQSHRQQFDVIGGGVGPGVTWSQDPAQRFTGGVQERQQRVIPEPALVGRRGTLLVRMRGDERAVEVDHVEPRVTTGVPHLLAAAARATAIRSSAALSTASRVRHAVGVDATAPNNSGWSRNTAKSEMASPPSAIITAKSTTTWPRS
jgi:hypothetical protein